jgi:RNA polymerase sigma-70 factor (ECF subfamily)
VRIVTRNKFIDRLKQRLRWKEKETLPWDDATAHAMPTPPTELERAALEAAIRELAPDEQRVLDGIYRQGKTYQEVSDHTGIPLGTMKRRLRDALATLRRQLAVE